MELGGVNGTETSVTGLTPGVYYTFSVTAENAVSSQDNNINARTVRDTANTEEGGITQYITMKSKTCYIESNPTQSAYSGKVKAQCALVSHQNVSLNTKL